MSAANPERTRCEALTRSGHKCKQRAGARTSHTGVGRCWLHGGASPQAELSGTVQLARREAVVMGRPLEFVNPEEALLECIRIAAAEVQYASERISELDPDDAVGPVITTRPLKEEKGAESLTERVEEHGPPALHIWIEVRHRAMDRLVAYTKVALAANIEERRVRLAEGDARRLAGAVRGILTDLGVIDRPEAPEIVRRHLLAASSAIS